MRSVLAQLRRPWFWVWLLIAALLTLFTVYWSAYQGTGSGIPGGWAGGDVYLQLAAVKFATVVAAVPLAFAIGFSGPPALGTSRGLWVAAVATLLGVGIGVAVLTVGPQLFLLGIGAGIGRALLIGAMGVGSLAAVMSARARTGAPRVITYIVAIAAALVCGLHLGWAAVTSLSPTL